MTKEELTDWALANGWRLIAGHPSLTKPGAPKDPISTAGVQGHRRHP